MVNACCYGSSFNTFYTAVNLLWISVQSSAQLWVFIDLELLHCLFIWLWKSIVGDNQKELQCLRSGRLANKDNSSLYLVFHIQNYSHSGHHQSFIYFEKPKLQIFLSILSNNVNIYDSHKINVLKIYDQHKNELFITSWGRLILGFER